MTDDDGVSPNRSGPTGRVLILSVGLSIVMAAVAGAVLAFGSLVATGHLMAALLGAFGGPILGAALGLSLGLRVPADTPPARVPWILRAFPSGHRGALCAWGLALLLLASPYALLSAGGLPPITPIRLGVTALVALACFLQCARRGRFWPAIVLPLWPLLTLHAMDVRYPCWQASNAAWCGHMCDGPPAPGCRAGDYGAQAPEP